jgi:alanine racemase
MSSAKGTFLRLDLQAVISNYHFFKKEIGKTTKILAVVKAFAYGHEAVAIAKKLEKEQVAYFGVAYVQEGIALREAGIKTPILVLHPQMQDVSDCIKYNLEPNIYSFRILEVFQEAIKKLDKNTFKIHLKFNTGLNRLGFVKSDIKALTKIINRNINIQVASVFSHLVASEDHREKDFTQSQIEEYKSIVQTFAKYYKQAFIKHLANTSGTLNYPEAHFDMVRIGIGLYGYANEKKWTEKLKNVGSLHTQISQIHLIKKGDSVGYNRAFIAKEDTLSATLPIGHADGIPRTWGNGKAYVTINNVKAPLLGNVCMDMIMVDVTDIVCKEGDPVIIFDTQETVEDLASNTQTISYELLTAISQRVKRIFDNE